MHIYVQIWTGFLATYEGLGEASELSKAARGLGGNRTTWMLFWDFVSGPKTGPSIGLTGDTKWTC